MKRYARACSTQAQSPAASSPGELAAFIKSDTAKWSRIIREKNIKAD